MSPPSSSLYFFFNAPATTEIYTLSLHDALPISEDDRPISVHLLAYLFDPTHVGLAAERERLRVERLDRKSTRLNSSHSQISYAVFCLKKKKNKNATTSDTKNELNLRVAWGLARL